ncbi:hypothetical protein GBA52_026750 [Prunus armeniaca]|nr:hypothetical protein GBA52_026750 [Prunus armeniaca]
MVAAQLASRACLLDLSFCCSLAARSYSEPNRELWWSSPGGGYYRGGCQLLLAEVAAKLCCTVTCWTSCRSARAKGCKLVQHSFLQI